MNSGVLFKNGITQAGNSKCTLNQTGINWIDRPFLMYVNK